MNKRNRILAEKLALARAGGMNPPYVAATDSGDAAAAKKRHDAGVAGNKAIRKFNREMEEIITSPAGSAIGFTMAVIGRDRAARKRRAK